MSIIKPPGPSDPPPFGKERAPSQAEPSSTTRIAIIEEKLQGGNRAFAALRDANDHLSSELAVVKEKLTPKPPNWWGVILSVFGAAGTVIGAVWLLRSMFDERPTRDELKADQIEQHEMIEQLRTDYRDLRDKQIEGKSVLDGLDKKVDQLLQRINAKTATKKSSTPAP
jgi:hypothetical protein